MPNGTLPAEYFPIIGYGLTFVSSIVVGAIVGIHLQKRKEAHEVKLKEMDIQQKRDGMSYGELKDFKAKKQAAGELIIRHMALDIQQIQVRKQLYELMLTEAPSSFSRKQNAMYREQLDGISARWAKQADDDVLGLYYAYFANPETDGHPKQGSQEDMASRKASWESYDRDEKLQHELYELSVIIQSRVEHFKADTQQVDVDVVTVDVAKYAEFWDSMMAIEAKRKRIMTELLEVLDTRLTRFQANLFGIQKQIEVTTSK